jgi:hypothetical protein
MACNGKKVQHAQDTESGLSKTNSSFHSQLLFSAQAELP